MMKEINVSQYILIGLYTVSIFLVFIFLELAAILFLYYRSGRDTDKSYIFAFFVFFITIAIGRIFYIIFDFSEILGLPNEYTMFAKISAIVTTTCALLPLLFVAETKVRKKKPVYSIFSLLLPIVVIFNLGAVWMFTGIPILFLLIFFTNLWRTAKGIVKRSAGAITIGLVLLATGLALGAARDLGEPGLPLYISGFISQFIAAALLVYGILNIPSFSEFEWDEYIVTFYIFHSSGIPLYSYKESQNMPDSTLLGGFFTAIWHFATESGSQPPQVIDARSLKFLIEHGKNTFIVGVSKKNLYMIREILVKILQRFEDEYKDVLSNEAAFDVTQYKNFDKIVKKIVPQ